MANSYFKFKQFVIHQDACAMKVTTDACLFGAWCAAEIASTGGANSVLDIGGGTGLLSLMVRQKNAVLIDVVEIDPMAAKQATQNCDASHWPNDFTIFGADIVTTKFSKTFDIIISNPPFYEGQLQGPYAQRNTAHHSTALSLQKLLETITLNLVPAGSFFLLLPFSRLQDALQLFAACGLAVRKKVIVHQTTSHAPFRVMLHGSTTPGKIEESHLFIKDDTSQYSVQFRNLLKDYYLHL